MFHSFVSDIEKYYAAIDVLILPSYREGFGNVVIEAGAVGTPAIVSNIPGPIDA
ncbi:MAG: glycosyltransferase [Faecalimonas sp.]